MVSCTWVKIVSQFFIKFQLDWQVQCKNNMHTLLSFRSSLSHVTLDCIYIYIFSVFYHSNNHFKAYSCCALMWHKQICASTLNSHFNPWSSMAKYKWHFPYFCGECKVVILHAAPSPTYIPHITSYQVSYSHRLSQQNFIKYVSYSKNWELVCLLNNVHLILICELINIY